jgi:GT2 family glycosyltransferase
MGEKYMKDLGIVICNFNKVDYLKGCLETLYKSDFEKLSYDVIVVDNASTDGSSKFVKDNYPQIILLQNETNSGGSGGFDRGIRYAMQKEYGYVVLLDNDILLEENTLLNLFKYIKINPKVGAVGSKICTMDNKDILQELGGFIDFENRFSFYNPLKSHKDDSSLPDVVVCDYVPACCMITTNEVLKKVGSFNTDHFIYWDDMDWCTRVKKVGYEIHAINNSRVFHKMGLPNHTNTFSIYYLERNKIMFFLKYLEDDKFENFVNVICNRFITLTFFSNLKGNYATAKSFLCAIDDLFTNNLGKQEKSVLTKEKTKSIFETYGLSSENRIALCLNDNLKANRTVFELLSKFFRNVDCYTNEQYLPLLQNNLNVPIKKMKEFNEKEYDKLFIVLNHILNYTKKENTHQNTIFIDEYLNSSSSESIDTLLSSYMMYKDIFINIYQPSIQTKLATIRKKLLKHSEN